MIVFGVNTDKTLSRFFSSLRMSARMQSELLVAALFLSAVFLPLNPLLAQTRYLDWDSIHVDAKISEDGKLEVSEIQAIRFTGDWNGGYRIFNTGWGQTIQFQSMERRKEDGTWLPLRAGSTDFVDQYLFAPGTGEARWRARSWDDPPFENERIEYRLNLTYSGVLSRKGDGVYALDHDFGFADRDTPIREMTVRLTWDKSWSPVGGGGGDEGFDASKDSLEFRSNGILAPGQKMIVRAQFRFHGDPALLPPSPWKMVGNRLFQFTLLILGLLGIHTALFYFAKSRGAYNDPPYFQNWDQVHDGLGEFTPEETALLSEHGLVSSWMTRLILDGKIRARSEQGQTLLERMVPVAEFEERDRSIIESLFVDGKSSITADDVRKHYRDKKTSFDLSARIEGAHGKRIDALGLLPQESGIGKVLNFFVENVLGKTYIIIPTFLVGGVLSLLFLEPILSGSGVSGGRVFASLFFALFTSVMANAFDDNHYGFNDLIRNRMKFVRNRFFLALIPSLAFFAFYFWSSDLQEPFWYGVLAFCGFLSFQHVWRFSAHKHVDQIQTSLRLLGVKNYLYSKLLSDDPCDIPIGFAPYIPAFDLDFTVEYRIKNLGKNDCAHLLPQVLENIIAKLPELKSSSSLRWSSPSSTSTAVGISAATAGVVGAGGLFGGGGASASWSDMSSFSSASSYSPPSSSSSSSGGSSSGGGGGGGW